jgi:hypothetical protein
MNTTKKTTEIKTISIKITFVYSTNLCIAILSHPKSTQKAKDEASAELLKYAKELDRIDNLTK